MNLWQIAIPMQLYKDRWFVHPRVDSLVDLKGSYRQKPFHASARILNRCSESNNPTCFAASFFLRRVPKNSSQPLPASPTSDRLRGRRMARMTPAPLAARHSGERRVQTWRKPSKSSGAMASVPRRFHKQHIPPSRIMDVDNDNCRKMMLLVQNT